MIGRKILMLSKYDWAASGWRIAEAINLTTNNYVIYMVLNHIGYPKKAVRYPSIYKKKDNGSVILEQDIERVQSIVNDVDLIHFKGDEPPDRDFIEGVTIPEDKPIIVTVHGSGFRRGDNPVAQPVAPFDRYDHATMRTVGDPTLNYEGFNARFTQIPYPTHEMEYNWKPRKLPVISHSPSNRTKKGTKEFLEAIEMLRAKGVEVRVDIIENESYDECVKRKGASTLFFDQTLVGWYGNSAVEAMAQGVPTLCNISQEAHTGAEGAIPREFPVINTGKTAKSIYKALKYALGLNLEKLSLATKDYCDYFHGYKTVGAMWGEIYKEACTTKI